MKLLQHLKSVTLILVVLISFSSCSKEELNSDGELSGISVSLKSSSALTSEVYLEIEAVQVRTGKDANSEASWVSLTDINAGTYNVSDLTDDLELTLVNESEMASGFIYEMRLVLGDNNFLNMNEVLVSLDVVGDKTPSNVVETEFMANRFYDVIINLDLDEAISYDENTAMMTINPKLYTEIRQMQF
ncbi:DUF4382 domain-containing protein [Winogradskyella rapida]|uniref:DUF4382 domain-containing protein n=1 Tax=Winogradskyella rapida TaxID=549701 RepID=A0ABW3KTL0_9FLAO